MGLARMNHDAISSYSSSSYTPLLISTRIRHATLNTARSQLIISNDDARASPFMLGKHAGSHGTRN